MQAVQYARVADDCQNGVGFTLIGVLRILLVHVLNLRNAHYCTIVVTSMHNVYVHADGHMCIYIPHAGTFLYSLTHYCVRMLLEKTNMEHCK